MYRKEKYIKMSYLLGLKNNATQSVVTNGTLNLGSVYRRFCRKNQCGIPVFSTTGTSVTLQHSGIYHITANITFTAPTAGVVIFQLAENGSVIPGAIASETITTATTETKTTSIDYLVIVDKGCVLGTPTTITKALSLINAGVGATISNVVFNIIKEV